MVGVMPITRGRKAAGKTMAKRSTTKATGRAKKKATAAGSVKRKAKRGGTMKRRTRGASSDNLNE